MFLPNITIFTKLLGFTYTIGLETQRSEIDMIFWSNETGTSKNEFQDMIIIHFLVKFAVSHINFLVAPKAFYDEGSIITLSNKKELVETKEDTRIKALKDDGEVKISLPDIFESKGNLF